MLDSWDSSLNSNYMPELNQNIFVVQLLSHVQLFVTPQTIACKAPLSFTTSQSLLKLISIESVMPSSHLILFLLLLPSIFPSSRVFSNESALRFRWPKFWSLSISPSSEYSGLISFRIDWVDLLAVQGALRSLLQHCSLKASVLWCSAFFGLPSSSAGKESTCSAGDPTLISGLGRSPGEGYSLQYSWALMAQMVMQCGRPGFNPSGWEGPLEEGMATQSSILAWRIPMDRGAWWAAVLGITKGRTRLSN